MNGKKKIPGMRVVDYQTVAGEILLVLDAYRVPAYAVDEVFAQVKQEMSSQPVTVGTVGLPQKEAERRKADMVRRFGLLKKHRVN